MQPELPNLKQFRIVVATCTMAAKLHHLGMPRCFRWRFPSSLFPSPLRLESPTLIRPA